jgi:hypothetical protein
LLIAGIGVGFDGRHRDRCLDEGNLEFHIQRNRSAFFNLDVVARIAKPVAETTNE